MAYDNNTCGVDFFLNPSYTIPVLWYSKAVEIFP